MKFFLFFSIVFIALILSGCTQQQACSLEAKLCPDGSSVSRNPAKNCAFDDCQQLVGNDKDAHGCILSAGYSWCEATKKCYRPWEEPCQGQTLDENSAIVVIASAFCGQDTVTGVAVCGEYVKVYSSFMASGVTYFKFSNGRIGPETNCPDVSPDSVTEDCRQLNALSCTEKKVC